MVQTGSGYGWLRVLYVHFSVIRLNPVQDHCTVWWKNVTQQLTLSFGFKGMTSDKQMRWNAIIFLEWTINCILIDLYKLLALARKHLAA